MVQHRIAYGLEVLGGDVGYLVLTSGPELSWLEFMKAFGNMRGWLRRQIPVLEYVATKEEGHRSGMKHLNVLLSGWRFIDQAELSRQWEQRSGARVVWIEAVEVVPAAARYVSKYVSKALGEGDVRKCVSFSRGFPKLPGQERHWKPVKGASVLVGLPTGVVGRLGAGCLVTLDMRCGCLARMGPVGLDAHLFLQRVQERGPP